VISVANNYPKHRRKRRDFSKPSQLKTIPHFLNSGINNWIDPTGDKATNNLMLQFVTGFNTEKNTEEVK
jgi:hypothetical protein